MGEAILVTGASGFLGSLVAAAALRSTDATVVLPLRQPEDVRRTRRRRWSSASS